MRFHHWILSICSVAFLSCALSEEVSEGATEAQNEESKEAPKQPTGTVEDDFDPYSTEWGSYYDPKNIFCGNYDCYRILGFDYDSFGKSPPDTKVITKRYRRLGRIWHPDKSTMKNAKERFVKIARAYEVLTNIETRKEYDDMRFDQELYYQKYGTSVIWNYAPKSDTLIVLVFLLVVGNLISWYMQKHRWQMVADRLIRAAVEDWTPSMGGSPESKQLREEALAILAKKNDGADEIGSSSHSTPTKSKKKSAVKKVSGKEKKQREQELLKPIVVELVSEMHDFGGGFHKPTWRDLLVVSIAKMPYNIAVGTMWQMKYWIRRLQKKELNEEEKEVLTERAVGPVVWDTASDEERKEMVDRQLWVKENFLDWSEEQEVKTWNAAEQKHYFKMKKKGKLEKLE